MGFRPNGFSHFFAEQHVPSEWTITLSTVAAANRRSDALDRSWKKPVTADLNAAIDAAGDGARNLAC